MKYLLDTNILSEFDKKQPNDALVRWARSINPLLAYICTVSIGEIRRGVELKRKRHPEAAERFENALMELENSYQGKILPLDQKAAHIWGKMSAEKPNHPIDTQIAAIAVANDAVLVTRNTKDFKGLAVEVLNPFEPVH